MRSSVRVNACPVCGWNTLPIIYGLPGPDLRNNPDIVLGGCLIDPMSPDSTCSNCDWRGQKWHMGAPLPPIVWIIRDPAGKQLPIGLVSSRYDSWMERFIFGTWASITSNSEYKAWLHEVSNPQVWTAAFGDLSPAVVAHLRIGVEHFTDAELVAAGFFRLEGKAPKFDVVDPHDRPGSCF